MEKYIWGCGRYGKQAFQYFNEKVYGEIKGFIDSKKTGTFLEKNIYNISEVLTPSSFIIVSVMDYKPIEMELQTRGYRPIKDYILLNSPVKLISVENYIDACGNILSGKVEDVSVIMSAVSRIEIGTNVNFGKNVQIICKGFSRIKIGDNSCIGNNVTITCEDFSNIDLGQGYICGDNISIEAKHDALISLNDSGAIGSNSEICVGNSSLIVGKDTDFDKRLVVRTFENSNIEIGDDCMFSYNISIRGSQGHQILVNGKEKNVRKNVYIADHVWVGMNVNILPGTHIRENSVIGAASVLNKNYDEGSLVVGNGGRIIGNNINWRR